MAAVTQTVECSDFLEFQDALQQMRQIDDKIIYLLNTTIPTESFKGQVDPKRECKDLFRQIEVGRSEREAVITRCLNATRNSVKQLKKERDSQENDPALIKSLRMEQNKLRLLQSELNVEDVVKERTNRVYHEKCRAFYKPDN